MHSREILLDLHLVLRVCHSSHFLLQLVEVLETAVDLPRLRGHNRVDVCALAEQTLLDLDGLRDERLREHVMCEAGAPRRFTLHELEVGVDFLPLGLLLLAAAHVTRRVDQAQRRRSERA